MNKYFIIFLLFIFWTCSKKPESKVDKTKKIDRPVDTTLQMFWETKIKCYCINKSGISDHTFEAGGSTLAQKNHSKLKLLRNIKRSVYRIKILYLSKFQNKKI